MGVVTFQWTEEVLITVCRHPRQSHYVHQTQWNLAVASTGEQIKRSQTKGGRENDQNHNPHGNGAWCHSGQRRVQDSSFALLGEYVLDMAGLWGEWTHLCFLEGPVVVSWVWGHRKAKAWGSCAWNTSGLHRETLPQRRKYQQFWLLLPFQTSKVKKQYEASRRLKSADEHGRRTETPRFLPFPRLHVSLYSSRW